MTNSDDAARYEARKQRERERQASQSLAGAGVVIPPVRDPARRAEAELSLRAFCEHYFQDRFPLAWAPHHLIELEQIESVVTHGGRQAVGDPRGDGKTTRLEVGVLWAVITGRHQYAALLTAVGKHSHKRITTIKVALLTNDLLYEDFPEVCAPIRKMGGVANRGRTMHTGQQHCWPAADDIWTKNRIVLPTVEGSLCSGSILESAGLLEATRGLNAATADGAIIRPTVVLVDDPQTPKSARSPVACQEREDALTSGIIYLSGPNDAMAAFCAVTVMRPGDMADRLLDRETHPEWHGIRNQMLVSFPGRMDLWDKYAEIYREELAAGDRTFPRATEYYTGRREEMDAGAVVTWPERQEKATSAIELAMRKFIENRASFYSEMQNAPELDTGEQLVELLPADDIAKKTAAELRYEVPPEADRLVFFVDVHADLLYYAVGAFLPGFTGVCIDYGTWPPQKSTYFDKAHARQKIQGHPQITAATQEGQVEQAIDLLFGELAARRWHTAGDIEYTLEFGLTDAGWNSKVVYRACRAANRRHGLNVLPSHGLPFTAKKCPISRWDRSKIKGRCGDEWHIPPANRGNGIRHVLFDPGRRKSFMHRRLSTPAGDPGSLTLFHAPPARHRMIADHLTSESGVREEGAYGDWIRWALLPGRDNHLLDCVSGVCTANSIAGGELESTLKAPAKPKGAPKRKRVKYL